MKILNTTLKELRYAFKVFSKYRHIRKVSVFGSARTRDGEPAYQQAADFSQQITQLGFMVITGAGDGVMKASQGGAGREKSFGVKIRLPFEQFPNEFIADDPKLITFKYFFTRKLVFVKETDAIVIFPGGFGTHDEAFESLTLIQTGKTAPLPIVFIDRPGGSHWHEWLKYIEGCLLKGELISPDDLSLFKVMDSVTEAVREITTFYRSYHSSRYVNEQLVIRLNHPISDHVLHLLNRRFESILTQGSIERSSALPDEADEPEWLHLSRLVLWFNRKDFGKLRQMIDMINRGEFIQSSLP
ncbi:MAG: LOG family protein [Candidatus Tectomicrobia bacterium]|nr:LOG family protein [Candidatus Tectomicrobia bacterium]